MENEVEYISYKKVIVFGTSGSGKSTLAASIKTGNFKFWFITEIL